MKKNLLDFSRNCARRPSAFVKTTADKTGDGSTSSPRAGWWDLFGLGSGHTALNLTLLALFFLTFSLVHISATPTLTFKEAWKRPTENMGTYSVWASNWSIIFTVQGTNNVTVGLSPEMAETSDTKKITFTPTSSPTTYWIFLTNKEVTDDPMRGSTGHSRVLIHWGSGQTIGTNEIGNMLCDQYPGSMIRFVGFGQENSTIDAFSNINISVLTQAIISKDMQNIKDSPTQQDTSTPDTSVQANVPTQTTEPDQAAQSVGADTSTVVYTEPSVVAITQPTSRHNHIHESKGAHATHKISAGTHSVGHGSRGRH